MQILLVLQDLDLDLVIKNFYKRAQKMPIYFYGQKCGKDILRFTITVSSMFCRDKEMRPES